MRTKEEVTWRGLRGEDLSLYIAGPLKTYECSRFAMYIQKFGTQQDFSNWIANHPQPDVSICRMFSFAPDFAKVWLSDYLKTNTTGEQHYNILKDLSYHSHLYKDPLPQALEMLQQIKLDAIDPENNWSVFNILHLGNQYHLIEKHWDLFQDEIPDPVDSFLADAAHHGCDLHDKLNVVPAKPLEYFESCCAGGLLHRAQQYAPAASQVKVINSGLLEALLYKNDPQGDLLEYLWETYPTQPWHKKKEIFKHIANAPEHFVEKMVAHFQRHDPHTVQEHISNLTSAALNEEKYQIVNIFLPHLNEAQTEEVFSRVIFHKIQKGLEFLLHPNLQNTIDQSQFFNAVKKCWNEEAKSWAEEIYNEIYVARQKRLLQSKLQNLRDPEVAPPTRKI